VLERALRYFEASHFGAREATIFKKRDSDGKLRVGEIFVSAIDLCKVLRNADRRAGGRTLDRDGAAQE